MTEREWQLLSHEQALLERANVRALNNRFYAVRCAAYHRRRRTMLQNVLSVILSVVLAYICWLITGALFTGQLRLIIGVLAAVACMGGGGYLGFRKP